MRTGITMVMMIVAGHGVAAVAHGQEVVVPADQQGRKVRVVPVEPSAGPAANPELAAELAALHARDQGIRGRVGALGIENGLPLPEVFLDEWQRIDQENMDRLREIVKEHGWPGRTLVGEKGALTAFLIVQHADPATQREFLPMMRDAAEAGELSRSQLAMLEDRVRLGEGRKQVYGTQLGIDAQGKTTALDLEDPERVDERRAEVGLPPLAMYLKMVEERGGGGGGAGAGGEEPSRQDLRAELIAMQKEFTKIGPGRFDGKVTRDEATWPADLRERRREARERVEALLTRVMHELGYPTEAAVGADGVRAYFSLLSQVDTETQERALGSLERKSKMWAAGAMSKTTMAQRAWLSDKLRAERGEAQLYGMHFERRNGKVVVRGRVDDEAKAEERRAEAGLPALKEVLEVLNGKGEGVEMKRIEIR